MPGEDGALLRQSCFTDSDLEEEASEQEEDAPPVKPSKKSSKKPSTEPSSEPSPEPSVPEVDDDLAKAMRFSTLEASNPSAAPNADFDEEQLRQALAMSEQESHASPRGTTGDFDEDQIRQAMALSEEAGPSRQPAQYDDAEFERLLAESAKEYETLQEQQKQIAESQAKEDEFIKESERMAAEFEAAMKRRRKKEKEEYSKQLQQIKAENKQEYEFKERHRAEFLKEDAKRRKEIAAEEKKARIEAERQAEQARRNNLRPNRSDDDAETQAMIQQAMAASLGDEPAEGEGNGDDPDADIPVYTKKLGPEDAIRPVVRKYTTTSRSPLKWGKCVRITPAILEEMREKWYERCKLENEKLQDSKDPFPEYYKYAKDDPASAEGKAAGKKKAKPKPKEQAAPKFDYMATAMHGGTRTHQINNIEARTGRRMPAPQVVTPVAHATPWMARFEGIQDRVNSERSWDRPRDRS